MAFVVGRKEKVASGKMVASGTSTSGVVKIIDEDFGYINIEWDLQEKKNRRIFHLYFDGNSYFHPRQSRRQGRRNLWEVEMQIRLYARCIRVRYGGYKICQRYSPCA